MTVQGNSITIPTGTASYSAIDTGTTLIGGPASAIANIFAQIPGSAPASGNYNGYYSYRESFQRVSRACTEVTDASN